MKKLPLGISTLNKIIAEGYAYVDKSRFVHDLVESGSYYFLSRPRRFGKSLFVDTLKEAFEGNRELFRGLWLEDHWDWETRHPVIRISFGEGVFRDRARLEEKIWEQLTLHEERLGVDCAFRTISGRFGQLIEQTAHKFGQGVAVLVDEYDKPILDCIADPVLAADIREGLKDFYSVLKDSDAYLRFVFLTGVSKFSKVSLFSGLNNLTDITLEERFSSICGWTEAELTASFTEHLKGKGLDEIRRWYNGYSWLGEKVYNPYSLLSHLRTGLFRNYWFETGTPTFLIELLKKRRYQIPAIENIRASESLIGAFDVDFIEPENLLFQTGYLTVAGAEQMAGKTFYALRYPNMEVKASLTDTILNSYVQDKPGKEVVQQRIYRALQADDPGELRDIFHALFAAIPHDWYRKNNLAAYEGYYCSIFYCVFAGLGLDTRPEESTNRGRIDMTVLFENRAYVFEFKVTDLDQTPGSALEQIKRKGYADKYRVGAEAVYLIGVEFDREARNIVGFEWERG
ncbi:ATP-binding protein [Desulfonatronum parangueonense]